MKSSAQKIFPIILTSYLLAGIFGPCIILGTLVSTGNGNLYYQIADGVVDYQPKIIASRKHIVPEKRYELPVQHHSDQQAITADQKVHYWIPDEIPSYEQIFRDSAQRPRDPPVCA